jgi:hypothetical protein
MPPLGVIYTSVAVAADSQNVLLFSGASLLSLLQNEVVSFCA